MQHQSSETDTGKDITRETGTSIGLALPVRDSALFTHGATPHILNFLSDNPDIDVSIRQLSRVVPMSERATREAVDALEANELIQTYNQGNARRVHINRARLDKPADPIRTIPQTEFQTPVRVACRYIDDELDDVRGIILFGSVARGTADRQSDIDLWVLVADDHLQQRHEANKLATQLEDIQIPPTIALADATEADFEANWDRIRAQLEADDQDWAAAQRHSFELIVETPESILSQSDRIEAEELFGKGITLLSSELLERVKMEILSHAESQRL
jgi:predicted nucleotidyltransferase